MSRRIFRDIEEAIEREVRRITFHDTRTLDANVLEDTFDPLTGEIIQTPIEANFNDSSANTNHIQYPHFFVRLMKTREDRFSGRVVPQYGRWCRVPLDSSPKAFEIVISSSDGVISSPGVTITTTNYQLDKVASGFLIRLLNGNNIGTYIIDSITKSASGPHTITVSSTLVDNLSSFNFESSARTVVFSDPEDLNTIEVGDTFEDASAATFGVTAVDVDSNSITIDGVATPDTAAGSKITRSGDVFKNSDPSLVRFIVMDPSKPVTKPGLEGEADTNSTVVGVSPEVPLDAYYRVRIDSKERDTHIDILNRVWEEFNPPRSALPVIRRTSLSAEQLLTADIPTGGSSTVEVEDNSNFDINNVVFIFNDLVPTKDNLGRFPEPFKSKVIGKVSTDQIVLEDTVPDTFKIVDCSKIVSNAEFRRFAFHFVDHVTKDVEGAQYWVHEFIFFVQFWIDRLEEPEELTTISDVASPIEDFDGNVIIEDL